MIVSYVWEHNGSDSLLYVPELPGAYARGETLEAALNKLESEIRSYLQWAGTAEPDHIEIRPAQDVPSSLCIADADSDVLLETEKAPLTPEEYQTFKDLSLRSAADFLNLYQAVPDKHRSSAPGRTTFYGQVPRTAEEMYLHTKSVNAYYFGEIGVDTDNDGSILDCRRRGFALLEQKQDHLANPVLEGSCGELWSLRKVFRRFIWHDRIHAKAMYRMALREFGENSVSDPFYFHI